MITKYKSTNNKEDAILTQKAKKSVKSFEELYRKYANKVFNYFWYRTGHNKPLSEDLMQETFLRAFKNREKYKDQGYSYLTYLLTIAHNLLVDYYRKPKSIPVEELPINAMPYEIADELTKKYEAEALWRAIQSLSQKNRDILMMFYQQEMPVRDIAKVMGMTENAVKLNLSRTRKKLANHPYLQDIVLFSDAKENILNRDF